ncbi:hypothetical protein CLAIMM_04085 [Cladophialophora immunda]|nr:hypothetical protein CLAIMM_04085 [Cladophialophora immunda]
MRLLTGPTTIWIHAAIQGLATAVFTAAVGMGIWMARITGNLDSYHPTIGLVIFAVIWLQNVGGVVHHCALFPKHGRRTTLAIIHIWLGRIQITLGMINGGLGLKLSGDAERGEYITYRVVSGVAWLLYVSLITSYEIRAPGMNGGGWPEGGEKKALVHAATPDKLLFTQSATADEVLLAVQSLEQQHRDRSRTLRLFANAKPEILSFIWGSACIIIRLLRDFLDLFDKLADMLQRLARQLALFDLYARLYPHSTRLRESLVEGYDAYLEFCLSVVKMLEGGSSRKNRWLKSGSLKLMTKTLFKPVKQDFGRVISRLESLVDSIETEANAAEKEAAADHREVVNEQIDFKKYQDLLQWLDPVDTAAVLLDLSDIHLPGTGQWLIGNEACIKWFTNPSSILCLEAHVTDKSIVLYYFSDYRSVKSHQTRTVIQTLLADLGRQSNQVLEILEASTRRYRKENLACSLQVVTEILIQCLALYQEVHVVIDALDESGNRPELIQLLLSLQSKSQATNLFLTSRDEYDIRDMLGHVEQISVDSSDMTSDIDHFIQHTVKELINNGRLKLRDKTLRETIAQRLGDKADGMSVESALRAP